MNIYGEQLEEGEDVQNSNDAIVYLDCDKNLTLMECITSVKTIIDKIPKESITTLYVIKSGVTTTSFDWKLFWEYLHGTTRKYDIVYRGNISDIDFLMGFDLDFVTIFLSESNSRIQMLRAKNYKFEIV